MQGRETAFVRCAAKVPCNQRFIATTAAAVCLPCVREGGARSAPEGLLVRISNNPSVGRADSSLCTREPENARQLTGVIVTTAATVCRPCVREGGARSVPEGLSVTKRSFCRHLGRTFGFLPGVRLFAFVGNFHDFIFNLDYFDIALIFRAVDV